MMESDDTGKIKVAILGAGLSNKEKLNKGG